MTAGSDARARTRMIEAGLTARGCRAWPSWPRRRRRPGGRRRAACASRAVRAPGGGEINGLAEYAKARVAETKATPPDLVALERSIEAGGRVVGIVLLLTDEAEDADEQPVLVDREEVLRSAALAALAEVAVATLARTPSGRCVAG